MTSTLDRFAGVFMTSPSDLSNNMIVSPGFETASLLSTLRPMKPEEIGSNKFMESYCVNLERLSVQAHLTASMISSNSSHEGRVSSKSNGGNGSYNVDNEVMAAPRIGQVLTSVGASVGMYGEEEYIVEAFLENTDKMEALVRTLLALEFWRENVLFSRSNKNTNKEDASDLNYGDNKHVENRGGAEDQKRLAHRIASNGNTLRTAFILHAETTIVSILSLIFYRGIPHGLLEGSNCGVGGCSGDDALLSLVDYCARQLVRFCIA